MTVNVSSRNFRLLIGGEFGFSPLDFSAGLMSFDGADSKIDQSGLVLFTGRISIRWWYGCPESLDDRRNCRFARGQKITLDVADSTGALRRHPRGAMRVQKSEYDPIKKQLDLEIIDLLGLFNYRDLPGDDSGVCLSVATDKTTIANNLLSAVGAPSLYDGLSGFLNYPIARFSGSAIDQVGKLAFSCGAVLYVDNLERIRTKYIDFKPTTPLISRIVGESDVKYDRLPGAELPCERIKVSGVDYKVTPNEAGNDIWEEQYGRYGDVMPASEVFQTSNAEGLVYRCKTSTFTGGGQFAYGGQFLYYQHGSDICKIIFTTVQKPLGSIFTSPENVNKDSTQLWIDTKKQDHYYHRGGDRAIIHQGSISLRPLGAILPGSEMKDSLEESTESVSETLTEFWPGTSSVMRITTVTQRARGSLFPDSAWKEDPTLIIASKEVKQWHELPSGGYRLTVQSWSAAMLDSAVDSQGREIIVLRSKSPQAIDSNSGQTQPPAAEFCEFGNTDCGGKISKTEELPLVGEAHFASYCGSPYVERQREYQVEYVTAEYINSIAFILGALLVGRYKGQEFALDFDDAWYNWKPLERIDWTEPDGTRIAYLADGTAWVLSQRRCLVSADGIFCYFIEEIDNEEVAIAPYIEPYATNKLRLVLYFKGAIAPLGYEPNSAIAIVKLKLRLRGIMPGNTAYLADRLEINQSITVESITNRLELDQSVSIQVIDSTAQGLEITQSISPISPVYISDQLEVGQSVSIQAIDSTAQGLEITQSTSPISPVYISDQLEISQSVSIQAIDSTAQRLEITQSISPPADSIPQRIEVNQSVS